ncbi:phage neck terminator protein [Megasphaera elsdenii]|uniref:phage neck terminator protein n=1 Tax=Megasphaera elsdenii TaxID=907 RepID=UPI00242F6AA8|nr:hypothetical protein [Megasphaera elsdenii]
MTTRDKMDFLHGIIAELLGLPGKQVVWVNQNMPRIKRPFATLQFYGIHGEASEELRPSGPGKYDVRVPTSATLAVQYFGPDALEHLETLARGFERPTIADRCFAAAVVVYDTNNITDLSALLESQAWDERANIDLYIRYNHDVDDAPGYIESVVIESQLSKSEPDTTTIPSDPDSSGDSGSGDTGTDTGNTSSGSISKSDTHDYYIDVVEIDGTTQ